jgi:hypothetical protein
MNCLEFRRQLLIDPHSIEVNFQAHARECARCAEAQTRASVFESSLRAALAVPAPDQLAESILLRQATEQQRSRQRLRRGGSLLALAAGVVLAFGVGLHLQARPLPEIVVDHLQHEAFVLSMTKPVAEEQVRQAFASRGVTVGALPADISFVGCCPVGRYSSVHLLIRGSNGPVTVLYLTDDRVEARKDFMREGWLGRSVPLAHGTLVLLAHDAGQFDQIESQWRRALQDAT